MITTLGYDHERPHARTLPRVFSNDTRCSECRRVSDIRVHYDPGCKRVTGGHFHRLCPCGHEWLERSSGHAHSDIQMGNPRWVALCESCGARLTDLQAAAPRCCGEANVGYHDTTEPCDLCRRYAA